MYSYKCFIHFIKIKIPTINHHIDWYLNSNINLYNFVYFIIYSYKNHFFGYFYLKCCLNLLFNYRVFDYKHFNIIYFDFFIFINVLFVLFGNSKEWILNLKEIMNCQVCCLHINFKIIMISTSYFSFSFFFIL